MGNQFLTKLPKVHNVEKSFFKNWFWENCIFTRKIIKLGPYFTQWTKINWKWIKRLKYKNWNHKTLRSKLLTLVFWIDSKKKGNKIKINILELHQTKKLCIAKEIINRMKRQSMEWERIFPNQISDKGLIFNIKRNSYNSIGKE